MSKNDPRISSIFFGGEFRGLTDLADKLNEETSKAAAASLPSSRQPSGNVFDIPIDDINQIFFKPNGHLHFVTQPSGSVPLNIIYGNLSRPPSLSEAGQTGLKRAQAVLSGVEGGAPASVLPASDGGFAEEPRPAETSGFMTGLGRRVEAGQTGLKRAYGSSDQLGGSNINQVGGSTYELPIKSELYVKAATAFKPVTPENNPVFYKKLEKEIRNKTINLVPITETKHENEDQPPSHDTMSPAEQSADNPEVIKNLLRNLKVSPVEVEAVIKNYEELVMMCQRKTALELIKPMLKPKKDEIVPSDKELLTMLGWNGSENGLLYDDINKIIQGSIVFVQGLFSFFCFDNGEFSVGIGRHCGKNYACMLNWVIIVAFRLRARDPVTYTDAAIIELIKNMHYALYGFLLKGSIDVNFIRKTDGNAGFYIEGAKTSMKKGIFYDVTLKVLVDGIKGEVVKIPEPDDTLTTYFPKRKNATTVKNGGIGRKSSNKLTRKHHLPKIHNVAHTIKPRHNSTGVNTKKTRRKHHGE
jgi:hypothetical protein